MYYTELVFSFSAVLFALSLSFLNLFKKRTATINIIFSAICFLVSIVFAMIFVQLKFPEIISGIFFGKIYAAIIFIIPVLILNLFIIYPDEKLRKEIRNFLLAFLPGLAVSALVISGNTIVQSVPFKGYFDFTGGDFFWVYVFMMIAYLAVLTIVLLLKSRRIPNYSLRTELIYIIYGVSSMYFLYFFFSFILPSVFDISDYKNIGVVAAGTGSIAILNHAVSDVKSVDYKKFFIKQFYWAATLLLMFVPVSFLLYYKQEIFGREIYSFFLVSVLVSLYMFGFYIYLNPILRSFIDKDEIDIEKHFNDLFTSIMRISSETTSAEYHDTLYKTAIENFILKFEIKNAHLFLSDVSSKTGMLVFTTGGRIDKNLMSQESALIKVLGFHQGVLYTGLIYADPEFDFYRSELLEIFNWNEIEAVLPFFNKSNSENDLAGMLVLGKHSDNRRFSKSLLRSLDGYRPHFEHALLKGLVLDDIKSSQISEHDRIVVANIKRNVIPQKLDHIDGIRISAFSSCSSEYGGDYFDSVELENGKLGIIMADTSYSGVDSAILSLELYSAFHSKQQSFTDPDKIMNVLNWVIGSSAYHTKYSPAFVVTWDSSGELSFSGAAYNPLLLYNPDSGEFLELDTKGIPLGVNREYVYKSKSLFPAAGSVGVLYSGGFFSSINNSGEIYSISRIKKIIAGSSADSPAVICRKISNDHNEFIDGRKQVNDISVIIFKV